MNYMRKIVIKRGSSYCVERIGIVFPEEAAFEMD